MAARYAILLSVVLVVADAARIVKVVSHGFPKSIVTADLSKAVGIDENTRFVAKREALTAAGTRKVLYKQTYLGLAVYDTGVTAEHNVIGQLTGRWYGTVAADIEVNSTTAVVQPDEALLVLQRAFGHDLINDSLVVFSNERAELKIYIGEDDVARLAYMTSYVIEQSDLSEPYVIEQSDLSEPSLPGVPARPMGFVDATTGELLTKWNGMSHDSAGTVTAIGGNTFGAGKRQHVGMKVTFLTDGVTCRYNSSRVQVLNMKNKKTVRFTPSTFPCSQALSETYDFVNGGYSALNDVMYYAELIFDMFANYTGHFGPTDSAPLKARVHYGLGYENAYWDGTQITIGDGASIFCPLTALDIVAHEYAHGFTEFNSNLQYQYMSGGMNEAFSDMAGEAAEYYFQGSNDFLVGDEVTKSGSALRYMCNPPQDGKSIDSANSYTSSMNVHYTSGVYNKAFCLLAQTAGWDTAKAFKVFARANDLYWRATSTFNQGACGVQQASADLGYNTQDIVRAFAAVDVVCLV